MNFGETIFIPNNILRKDIPNQTCTYTEKEDLNDREFHQF